VILSADEEKAISDIGVRRFALVFMVGFGRDGLIQALL
jgi:hypothetical protein